jgi:tetratricopeptide (TPR) repeat protein
MKGRLNNIFFIIVFFISASLLFAKNLPESKSQTVIDIKAFSDFRKEKGLRNLEPQSITLISMGLEALRKGRREEAISYFKGAASLSPDLPQSYIYLARASFSLTTEGLTQTVGYMRDAWRALRNNFWWSFRTSGNFLIALYLSMYISIILLTIILIVPRFNLYIHDIHEDRRRLILLIPAVVFVFLGPIFGILASILPLWLYLKKNEKYLIYALFLIVAIMIPLVPFLSSFFGASANVTLRNIININSGLYTGDTVYLLKGKDDYETAFTYALDLKRKGHYKEAIEVYESLLGKYGRIADAKLYNNIANCYVGLNDNETALQYYTKALQITELASTYYNLSQMYREFFDFKKGEKFYSKALSVSPEKVHLFTGLRGTTVNSFVVDEILSIGELWALAFRTTSSGSSSGHLGKMLSFTNKWVSYFILILTIIAINIYERMTHVFAYRCVRCGTIQCSHCEKKLARGDMCHLCYSALTDITSLKVKERLSRIVQIHRYREDRIQKVKLMTLLLPGSGHLYYGWTIQGFLIMFFFIFLLITALIWTYFNPSVAMIDAAKLFRWVSLIGLALIYIITVADVFRKVPRRWH